ncbi:MAG: hypothetical protein ACXVQJ_11750, partial [Actinomycetota bacterium]
HRIPSGDRTLIEHWNGTAWKIVKSPNPGPVDDYLFDVAVTSASNAWAVGVHSDGVRHRTLILRWNGSVWKVSKTPNVGTGDNELREVTAASAKAAWAVGDVYDGATYQPVVLHWGGAGWKVQPAAAPGTGAVLFAADATASTDVWAVGYYVDTVDRALALHCC